MTQMPNQLIELPGQRSELTSPKLLRDVLSMIRLTGAIFLRAEFTSPWAYESPAPPELTRILSPQAERLILFHIIAEGQCTMSLASGDEVHVKAGDVVVLPYGDQHLVSSSEPAEPVKIVSLMQPPPWKDFPVMQWGGGGPRTSFVCGYLHCDDPIFDPVVRALPPIFSVTPDSGPTASWVASSIQYALQATDGSAAAEGGIGVRLPELLLAEVLRLYITSRPAKLTGWLAALQDPYVGPAMAHIHADPASDWTADELARRSACSRSTLDDRFRRLVGRSAMRYLLDWRIRLAASLLRDSSLGVAAVGYRVGYDSEVAFNRAFKRSFGLPPAQWRKRAMAP